VTEEANILPLSVIFLTFNDERLIEEGLQSVAGWVSEIFVVDSLSTDRTLDIARKYTSNIVVHPFENYAAQRNWAQDNLPITNAWIMHIDADERVSVELKESLQSAFMTGASEPYDGFMIARRTVFMGKWIRHGAHYPVYHLRVFRRDKGRCEDRLYDQHFTVAGNTTILTGDLIDTITTSLDQWMQRHIRWANMEVQEQIQQQTAETKIGVAEKPMGTAMERRRWLRGSVYGRMPLFVRTVGYFLYRYFLRLGFLDGIEGLIFHFLQGLWFRFYIDAKLWEARRNEGIEQ
jgi:glycosyltransferase involved in cell wall biosynthesis